jgi:DNA-binding transcriptional LysR family regulator
MDSLFDPALVYYLSVARHGTFTQAAQALGVSQPSLSVAVRKLEERIGAPLLYRGKRGVEPTPQGRILLAHAELAQRTLGAALAEMRVLDTEPRGRFVLGCHESLGGYALPGFMARFLARYPAIELTLRNANSREIEQAVVERQIDLGLVVNPARHPDCVVVELFADRVMFIVSAALQRKAGASEEELLRSLPMLHVPELRQTQYLLGALANRGLEPGAMIPCSSMELVKSLVLDGVGVGILPYRVATHGVGAQRLSALARNFPVFDDVITLVRRADMPMTAGARALVDALKEHGASLREVRIPR